ncbi:MAG: 5-formyltetrahydrofolate cyclo-ligase [Rhodocyclaceae bacterium]|jgi:5-formyltetrahydrofolate cyclo-ligase|nr:5-formyltetrahydrofolate cyclo-ligase [Rhodocyclaceae bacterium]
MPENTEDSGLFRARLRKTLLAKRLSLPRTAQNQHSRQICLLLEHWLGTIAGAADFPRTLGFCLPFRGEPDLLPLMTRLTDQKWALCVPVIEQTAAPMVFRHWQPDIPLKHDRHGVSIPDSANVSPPALLLVPVLGVDAQGYRLGYGGGYFDRTLAALDAAAVRPKCVGIGFSVAEIASIAPQPHDRRLDLLVTETGMRSFA